MRTTKVIQPIICCSIGFGFTTLVTTATEQDQQQEQDPEPFVVFEDITEASHIFILSPSRGRRHPPAPQAATLATLVLGYARTGKVCMRKSEIRSYGGMTSPESAEGILPYIRLVQDVPIATPIWTKQKWVQALHESCTHFCLLNSNF